MNSRSCLGFGAAGALVVLTLGCAPAGNSPPPENPSPPQEIAQSGNATWGDEFRQKYPFESLAARLEYESKRTAAASPVMLTADAKKRLDGLERHEHGLYLSNERRQALLMIHASEEKEFTLRDGFGLMRSFPSTRNLELPEVEPIPLATAPSPESNGGPLVSLPRDDSTAAQELPSLAGLFSFHQNGELDFVNLRGAGLVKNRQHVAGFRPHRFSKMPLLPDRPSAAKQQAPMQRWQLRRLELVSLLKHDKPVVYLSDNLPRMDRLKSAPTRPLTAFEEQALQSLHAGEDLSIEATVNSIHMLGSLRATKTCLQCHHGERGQLLGAFSYILERQPPVKVPEGPAPAP